MTKHTITLSALDLDITYSVKDSSPRGCHTVGGHDLKIGDKIVIDNYFHEIVGELEKATEEPEKVKTRAGVSISKGNSKMGAIPSVSLPACTTCNPDAPCFKKCYARRLAARRATVREAYVRNLETLNSNKALYWSSVYNAAATVKYFRYHVSGDIPDLDYFAHMVQLANVLPDTRFLAFTKQYTIVNTYLNHGGEIPANLKIIFSNWNDWKCKNPHSLPECEIILKGNDPRDDWKICGGNCTECACRGVGCWELKNGETIAIYEH